MAIEFIIQASNPRALRNRDLDDETLSDAVQSVFPMGTERAILVWNNMYVPLGYKYDLSLMVDDVIGLLEVMMASSQSKRRVSWASNTFASVWDIEWGSGKVSVQTQWNRVVGGTESILMGKPSVSVPEEDFLAEWKRPLEIVRDALRGAGYIHQQIPQMRRLEQVVVQLPRYGCLYQNVSEEGES